MKTIAKSTSISNNERVLVYVDGFNLYFGIRDAGLGYLRWLNLKKLAENLIKPTQTLGGIKYFTSRVSNDPDKQKRQSTYIEALITEDVQVYYGHYQRNTTECKHCGNIWPTFNEKMTDVNIATQIIIDAYTDKYDMAMLISGDSDLVPPIRSVHNHFSQKRVFVAFPPKRHNNTVSLVAKGSLVLGRKKLSESQFESEVTKTDGYVLKKPSTW